MRYLGILIAGALLVGGPVRASDDEFSACDLYLPGEVKGDAEVEQRLQGYLDGYLLTYRAFERSGDTFMKSGVDDCLYAASQITFELKDPKRYEKVLERIDALSATAPQAILVLGFALQSEWSARHGKNYLLEQEERGKDANLPEVGLGLGTMAMYGAMAVKPVVEHSLAGPFAYLALAYSVGQATGKSVVAWRAAENGSVLVSPASKLRLTMQSQEEALVKAASGLALDESASSILGAAAGVRVFAEGSKWVARIRLPGRYKALGLFALAGLSVAVQVGAAKAVEPMLHAARVKELRDDLMNKVASLRRLLRAYPEDSRSRRSELLSAGRRVGDAAFLLSSARDHDLITLQLKYEIEKLKTPKEERAALEGPFLASVYKVVAKEGFDRAGVRMVARERMLKAGIDPFDPAEAANALARLRSWGSRQRELALSEITSFRSPAGEDRRQEFREFLGSRLRLERLGVAARFAQGEVAATSEGLFFQVAALLDGTGDPALKMIAESVFRKMATDFVDLKARARE